MKKIILAALAVAAFCCGTLSATAQNRHTSDANIYGHIIDSKTKEHIPYVTISIKGTTYGTVADASGHYFLKNLPEGKHTVTIRISETKNEQSTGHWVRIGAFGVS